MKKYIILGLSLLISACASNNNKIAKQVSTIGDAGNVSVTNLTQAKDIASGTRTIRFSFNARGDKPQQVYWRCEFFDANGFIVGTPARFIEATIYPDQPQLETCTYPSDQAVDFKINFQNIATNMTIYH